MPISVDELKEHRFFEEWIKEEESNPEHLEELKILAQNCEPKTFKPKDPLTFVLGDKPCFYLILEGAFIIYFPTELSVKVDFKQEFDEDRILFAFRSKIHETIGEIELTQQFPQIRARCLFEKGETIAVPVEKFNDFLEKYPKMWRKLFRIQMKKLDSARHYAEAIQLESKKTGACIAASLLAIANDLEEDENKNKVEITMLLKDFRAYISEKTPATVTTKLNELRNKYDAIKILDSDKGVLAVEIDREKLKAVAAQRSDTPTKRKPKKDTK